MQFPIPENEIKRLEALISYEIMDTPPEREFDDIASLTAAVCDTPIGMVSFINEDRKWYKSKVGTSSNEMKREVAICAHTIMSDVDALVIEDTREDPRFADTPITQGPKPIIFYAGIPLVDGDGYALGTLCAIDHQPRKISDEKIELLKMLGRQVMQLMELRRNNLILQKIKQQQEAQYEKLTQFSYALVHDLRSPMSIILSLSELLKSEEDISGDTLDHYLEMINGSANRIKDFLDEMMEYYLFQNQGQVKAEKFSIEKMIEGIREMLDPESSYEISINSEVKFITGKRIVWQQILTNLISNGLKYNNKDQKVIEINVEQVEKHYKLVVKDNGMGIEPEDIEKIFGLLENLDRKDSSGQKGSGVGLALVKKLIEQEGGLVEVNSKMGEGSEFIVTI